MLVNIHVKILPFIVTCVLCFGHIAILEQPNCLSHVWLTFLKHYYWFVGLVYKKHVTMKELFLHKPEQKIDNDLHSNSKEFSNHPFY